LKITEFARKYYNPLVRVCFALAIAFTITRFPLDYIESLTYDARIRMRPMPKLSGNIALVSIDLPTIDKLKRSPDAKDHTKFLEFLKEQKPRAVLYLIQPTELVGGYEDLQAFAKTAETTPNFYVGTYDVPLKGTSDTIVPPPFTNLHIEPAPGTLDENLFAMDLVTRRLFLSYQGQTFLHMKLAGLYNPEVLNENKIRGAFDLLGSKQTFINYRPAGSYPTLSFYKTLNGDNAGINLKDKIVIIGRDLQTTKKDYIRTPYSREIDAMTVLEEHANLLDTLIRNDGIHRLPDWVNLVLTSIISILALYVVLALKPTRGLVILGATLGVFCLLSYLSLWLFGLWFRMAHPLLATFICYYFFIPYRLIIENRRSWEYYQKNKLLTQVEELKTNFLSMMSHDLKTPIARIQGMTDIVLRDQNPLSDRQREALLTLGKSSNELLEFVSSILNLGRIESKELHLHLQSKDPNQLVQEVIKKSEYLAKSKGIQVSTELEPMFSIKMDVDLMRQVIANLIENAIKYSAENTKIMVTTEDKEGRVVLQVSDQGQGIPEDEINHVFSKFYRSKNAKSSKIKGSGLGLYLAKYFVELHKGRISVDSSLGQGTTFTVELPADLKNEGSELTVQNQLEVINRARVSSSTDAPMDL
jgi:signal transduction histidine kinase